MIAQEADLDTHSRSCGSRFHNKEEKEKFCENMDYDLGTSSDSDSDEEFFFEADAFSGELTKNFAFNRFSNYRPNQQISAVSNKGIKFQTLRSGEAYMQKYMDEAGEKKTKRVADRNDRATSEQVLDPRTRLILFQLIQRQVVDTIEGCVSTGKEANVYHAISPTNGSLAVKIYKTSILVFKNRDKYVSGEFRYRNGYCKHNPRKMVSTWAEKEFRNLQRLHLEGISVPKPVLLKGHVLLMEFIGSDGWPAATLKDSQMDDELIDKIYCDCVRTMETIYKKCRLVHADLSEYNMLLYGEQLFIIDVSQSVEHDHPHSLEFMRKDIFNITTFFHGRGARVINMKRLFELIVDLSLDGYLENALLEERSHLLEEEPIFMSAFIPHKLDNIEHFERDDQMERMHKELNNPYQKIIGKTTGNAETSNDIPEPFERNLSDSGSSSISSVSTNEIASELLMNKQVRKKDESAESKKARKQAVKEENRERRTHKIPKKVKKQKEKQRKK